MMSLASAPTDIKVSIATAMYLASRPVKAMTAYGEWTSVTDPSETYAFGNTTSGGAVEALPGRSIDKVEQR
jgi:hypothetical protein